MRFRGRRVAITGGTGYVGAALARALLAEGAEVTVLARRPDALPALRDRPGVRLVRADVTRPETLDLAGHDVVVHGAAWVAFGIPAAKRERFWATNVGGTENVVDAARRAGVRRLVHVSSVAALGDTRGAVVDESFEPGDFHRSYYETTKRAAHRIALAARDLDPVAVLPAVVVGKARPYEDGARSAPRGPFDVLFERYARGRLPVLPQGDRPTPYVHVEDVVEGTLRATLDGRGPYLLTDGSYTLAELFAALAARTGRRAPRAVVPLWALQASFAATQAWHHLRGKVPPVSTELVTSLRTDMRYDSGRARRDLGWTPDLFGRLAADYGA